MKQRITLQDIACEAGVSKTIVSKIVNGLADGKVSLDKRKIIEEIIRKYDFVPLSSAKSLATQQNRQVAFLLSDSTSLLFENPVFAQMLRGVLDGCREKGYACQIDYCDFADISTFVMPENLRRRCVDGCILTGALSEDVLDKLTAIRIPSVLLGGEQVRNRMPVITRTSRPEYEIFLRYCFEKGHRRILISGCGNNGFRLYPELARGFPQMELSLYGTPQDCSTKKITEEFLALPGKKRPTLMAGNDSFCLELLGVLRENDILCPRDVSVISMVESEFIRRSAPPLTSFSADFATYGEYGARLLIDMLEQDVSLDEAIDKAREMDIKSIFTERDSVSKISQKGGFAK